MSIFPCICVFWSVLFLSFCFYGLFYFHLFANFESFFNQILFALFFIFVYLLFGSLVSFPCESLSLSSPTLRSFHVQLELCIGVCIEGVHWGVDRGCALEGVCIGGACIGGRA